MAGDLTQQNSQAIQNINEWGYALDGPSDYFMNNVVSPAVGNHDKSEGMFYNHFNIGLPNDQNTSKGVYYTYTIQDVQVIVLNTNDELTFSQPLAQKTSFMVRRRFRTKHGFMESCCFSIMRLYQLVGTC